MTHVTVQLYADRWHHDVPEPAPALQGDAIGYAFGALALVPHARARLYLIELRDGVCHDGSKHHVSISRFAAELHDGIRCRREDRNMAPQEASGAASRASQGAFRAASRASVDASGASQEGTKTRYKNTRFYSSGLRHSADPLKE